LQSGGGVSPEWTSPQALRLFKNDYITSFKFKKIIFFLFQFQIFFKWLAPKATGGDKSGGDENGGAEVAAPKSPVPMQVAVLPWRYDAEMGTANSLHASA